MSIPRTALYLELEKLDGVIPVPNGLIVPDKYYYSFQDVSRIDDGWNFYPPMLLELDRVRRLGDFMCNKTCVLQLYGYTTFKGDRVSERISLITPEWLDIAVGLCVKRSLETLRGNIRSLLGIAE